MMGSLWQEMDIIAFYQTHGKVELIERVQENSSQQSYRHQTLKDCRRQPMPAASVGHAGGLSSANQGMCSHRYELISDISLQTLAICSLLLSYVFI